MLDNTAQLQQEAVGALGVNLIHGALTCKGNPNTVIEGLLDNLERSRLTVSAVKKDSIWMQYWRKNRHGRISPCVRQPSP